MDKTIKDVVAGFKMYPVWLHQAYYFLSAKYKRTALGSLWIAGNFVFLSIAITIVFGDLFGRSVKDFLPYVMMGNLAATLCLWTLGEGPELYLSSGAIIRNHAYPFSYFTFEEVARVLMLFAHNLVIFYILMTFFGTLTIPHWTILPGLVIDVFIMMTWGTVVGLAAARFRDLRFLLANISMVLYFLTPIYWHYDLLSANKRWIADYNPLYAMVSLIRAPILGVPPTAVNWNLAFGLLITGVIAWFITFTACRRRIPFWV